MRIVWPNVFVVLFGIFALVLALKAPRSLAVALSAVRHIGSGGTAEERTLGLVVVGLICVTIVAVVKIVIEGKGRNP